MHKRLQPIAETEGTENDSKQKNYSKNGWLVSWGRFYFDPYKDHTVLIINDT